MRTAYNETWLANLDVVKTAKDWRDSKFITPSDLENIINAHPAGFFHPNLLIRILLFVASLIALLGVTGLLILAIDTSAADTLSTLALVYGLACFVPLETVLIRRMNHYKSGVTEALLYHSIGFVLGGVVGLSEVDPYAVALSCLLVFLFCAYRYLDLISTAGAFASAVSLLFTALSDLGGIAQNIIPFAFIAAAVPLYFLIRRVKVGPRTDLWEHCLTLAEGITLMIIYAAGNYLVVRELGVQMMDMSLQPGEDIPFSFIFYGLTVIVPIVYLYFGITKRDQVLLRVSLILMAFSVFTFKYYYSTGHHEVTFTVGGAALILAAILLLRYLRAPRQGYTSEKLKPEKWADANVEAFIISQTMGGNTMQNEPTGFKGQGGSFGGGGATGEY